MVEEPISEKHRPHHKGQQNHSYICDLLNIDFCHHDLPGSVGVAIAGEGWSLAAITWFSNRTVTAQFICHPGIPASFGKSFELSLFVKGRNQSWDMTLTNRFFGLTFPLGKRSLTAGPQNWPSNNPSTCRLTLLFRSRGLPLRRGHRNVKQSAPRALSVARPQFGVRSDVQVRLISGLHAPRTVGLLPVQAKSIINRSHEYFHASWLSPGDMTALIREMPFRALFRDPAGHPLCRSVSRCATLRHMAARTGTYR